MKKQEQLMKYTTLYKDRSFTKKRLSQAKAATKTKKKKKKKFMIDLRRRFRFPCKKWNTLFGYRSSFKRHYLPQSKASTTTIADLPIDLAEDVLSRLPLTSLRGFRATCKSWNSLSKDKSFTRKHLDLIQAKAAREFMVVVAILNCKVYLMSINLHGIHKGVDPSINRQGKLISLYDDSDQVGICRVYHCGGLLLCITEDYARFVVWNPYSCQTFWVEPPRNVHRRLDLYVYTIGYDNSKSSCDYKVLRFYGHEWLGIYEYEIYDLNSNSWRVSNVASDWVIEFKARGVSVKGNTYWFARELTTGTRVGWIPDFLICFDFAKERFGLRLPLPFYSFVLDTVTLSIVREEQLAVLFQIQDHINMEIWVTTKIEPDVVSWSKFLAVDMQPLCDIQFSPAEVSFIIDQDKKVVVVFDKDEYNPSRDIAYIVGENGYYKKVDLGEADNMYKSPLVCTYVPNSMQVKQGGKRKKYN